MRLPKWLKPITSNSIAWDPKNKRQKFDLAEAINEMQKQSGVPACEGVITGIKDQADPTGNRKEIRLNGLDLELYDCDGTLLGSVSFVAP